MVLGVAAGIADATGVDVLLVRLAFAALTVSSGLGVVLYVTAWAMSWEPLQPGERPAPSQALSGWRPVVAVGCIVVGALLVLRDLGVWFGDGVVWPLMVAGCGSAVIWSRTDIAGRARWTARGARMAAGTGAMAPGWSAALRILAGSLLVLVGIGVFVFAHQPIGGPATALVAAAVTAAGLALILTPWVLGLVHDVAAERRERIRSEERAEIATHLHDSVLNTLALIQRGDVSAEVASVARRQERELRAWLNGSPVAAAPADLRGAIDAVATRVEDMHHVPVDTVVVGDVALDDAGNAVALACQEAAINAARHSGAARVSIYVEADLREITAYVRDQGCGFDRALVPRDRRGISESIVGRMRRLGGTAAVTTGPGEGTEVQLRVPRAAS